MRKTAGGAECEKHLDALDWERFNSVFALHMNDTETQPSHLWPSFSQIFFANTGKTDDTDAESSWHTSFANMSCPAWSAVTIPTNVASSIPVLQVQGPNIDSIFDLLHVSLKMASLNPHTPSSIDGDLSLDHNPSSILPDSFIALLATLCRACHAFSNVSYAALNTAIQGVERVPCKPTVLGGAGERISASIEAIRAKLPAVPAARHVAALEKVDLKHPTVVRPYGVKLDEAFAVDGAQGGKWDVRLLRSSIKRKHGGADVILLSAIHRFEDVIANVTNLDGSAVHRLKKGLVTAALPAGTSFLEVNVTSTRDFFGLVAVAVNFTLPDAVLLDSVNATISCGYSPAISASLNTTSGIPIPIVDSLSDWLEAAGDLKTAGIDIPTRFHAITYDLASRSPSSPYLLQEISFLAGQTPLLFLQNARHSALQLPPALRTRLAIAEPCDHGISGRPSGLRVVYRMETMEWKGCLEAGLKGIEEVVAGIEGEVPSVGMLRHKKSKQGVVAINVVWTSKTDKDVQKKHREEMRVLLLVMENVRVKYGLPIILAIEMLEDTGLFRFILDLLLTDRDYDVYPSLPGNATASTTALVETCLGATDFDDAAARRACRDIKEYGKWFRKSIGGIVAEERMEAKHEVCSVDVSEHIPVTFDLEIAGETLKAVTFNLGHRPLTPSTLSDLSVSVAQFFDFFSASASNDDVTAFATTLKSHLHDAVKRNHTLSGKRYSKASFDFIGSSVEGTHPTNLYISVKSTKQRHIRISTCHVESTMMLGCALRVSPTSTTTSGPSDSDATVMVVAVDDGEAETESSGMRRMYNGLCRRGKLGNCEGLGVPAVFAGSWGEAVGVRTNGSWTEFRGAVDEVEKEILRRNKVGDKTFPQGRNEHFRITALVPPEKRTGDPASLLYHDDSVVGSMLGWIMGHCYANWPYWTNWQTGSTSDFIVLWSTDDPSSPVASIPAHIPPTSIALDMFLASPQCRYDSDKKPSKWCRSTGPACWRAAVVEKGQTVPVGVRLDGWGRRGREV
ncbi:hypothetical protein BC829DRAFT_387746 [Chytridium lagenaria]|nr:hypothetical protein BC829DRAFT_387746 [Chytridium lagenaria]